MANTPEDISVTELLAELRSGNPEAMKQLFPLVYDELHKLAHGQLRRLRPGQTLNTTALVHEAYLRLVGHSKGGWQDRRHFVAVAATAMRHIIIDEARRKGAKRRGGEQRRVPLDTSRLASEEPEVDLLALNEAMEMLAQTDPKLLTLVELRFFVGLSIAETAEVLEISESTVKREWRTARALLHRMLNDSPEAESDEHSSP